MSGLPSQFDPLEGRRLYIAHLADRLQAMESGRQPMNPLAYRLFARRITSAVADYPEQRLARQFQRSHPAVRHAFEQRWFEDRGLLRGPLAPRAAQLAAALLHRLRRAA